MTSADRPDPPDALGPPKRVRPRVGQAPIWRQERPAGPLDQQADPDGTAARNTLEARDSGAEIKSGTAAEVAEKCVTAKSEGPRVVLPDDPPVLTPEAARVLLRILMKASASRSLNSGTQETGHRSDGDS